VDQCANHYRKAGFICEFEKAVTEVTPEAEPSFLDEARPAELRRNDFPVAPNAACPGCRHPGSWWNAR
jgi:hypothetical protein